MSSTRVVVTGALGRIGRPLTSELRARGAHVVGVDVFAGADLQLDLAAMRGSVPPALESALAEADAIAHLAALMSWDEARADDVYRANVTGTLNLMRSLESVRSGSRMPRIVLASTGEVYPELAPVYLPIDESHPTRPTSHCGLSKLMAEHIVQFFSEAIREAIRRLQAVDRPGERLLLLARGTDGTPYRIGIADARDIVAGILLALEHQAAPGETFNVGPASAFSFDDAIAYMARRWKLPYVAVDLPLTPYEYETSVEKARRILGYAPRYTIFDMIDAATDKIMEHV